MKTQKNTNNANINAKQHSINKTNYKTKQIIKSNEQQN